MKVLLAPVEVAGVVGAIRHGLRRRGVAADVWLLAEHPFVRDRDRVIAGYGPRAAAALRAVAAYDVLHFHFGATLAEYADAALARATRRRLVLMHYWGDDCRIRLADDGLVPLDADAAWQASQRAHERVVRRRLRLAGRLCRAALVSDLELLEHVRPHFRTVYVVPTPLVLPLRPGAAPAPLAGEGPVVFHAPSSRLGKGSAVIEAAVAAVGTRRPLRPLTVSGVPRAAVHAELARADIVVDQLNSRTPGVLALEAMALGKPVLLEYRPELLAPFARDAPVVGVTAATLERELEALVDDPERRERLGRAGREYVERVHDAERVAGCLQAVYADARRARAGVFVAGPDGIRPLPSRPS